MTKDSEAKVGSRHEVDLDVGAHEVCLVVVIGLHLYVKLGYMVACQSSVGAAEKTHGRTRRDLLR